MRRLIRTKPVNNDFFALSVNGGIPRERLLEALQNSKVVGRAVKAGRCLLCKATDIDPTGLCLVCRSFMSDEERSAAQVYYENGL